MKIIISSRHFSPAFIGHMKAWYKLCEACGYTVKLFFAEEYEKYFFGEEYSYTTSLSEIEEFAPDYAVVQNIGFEDVELFRWCRKNKCYLFYILHEPYMGLSEILKEGNKAPKLLLASILNQWLCQKANKVIICSKYARSNCEKYMKSITRKLEYMPLLFLDDFEETAQTERQYISMIGTYAVSHGSDVFLHFMKEAYSRGLQLKFQIATRSDLKEQLSYPIYKEMEKEGALLLQQGRPLTEKEMCEAYRRSFVVWNVYRRSTQSGVLPNSYMQGTPVIASQLPSFEEFVIPERTGCFVESMEYKNILKAINEVINNGERINLGCREFFMKHFFYGSQIDSFREIIELSKTKKAIMIKKEGLL